MCAQEERGEVNGYMFQQREWAGTLHHATYQAARATSENSLIPGREQTTWTHYGVAVGGYDLLERQRRASSGPSRFRGVPQAPRYTNSSADREAQSRNTGSSHADRHHHTLTPQRKMLQRACRAGYRNLFCLRWRLIFSFRRPAVESPRNTAPPFDV